MKLYITVQLENVRIQEFCLESLVVKATGKL